MSSHLMPLFAASLLTTACVSSTHHEEEHPAHAAEHAHWSYEGHAGPTAWGELDGADQACAAGRAQSPIDLSPAQAAAAITAGNGATRSTPAQTSAIRGGNVTARRTVDAAAPDALAVHALAGLQLHTRHTRIAIQATTTADAWSVALGLHIVP